MFVSNNCTTITAALLQLCAVTVSIRLPCVPSKWPTTSLLCCVICASDTPTQWRGTCPECTDTSPVQTHSSASRLWLVCSTSSRTSTSNSGRVFSSGHYSPSKLTFLVLTFKVVSFMSKTHEKNTKIENSIFR